MKEEAGMPAGVVVKGEKELTLFFYIFTRLCPCLWHGSFALRAHSPHLWHRTPPCWGLCPQTPASHYYILSFLFYILLSSLSLLLPLFLLSLILLLFIIYITLIYITLT